VDFNVHNDGSIPVNLGGIQLSGVPGELGVSVVVDTTAAGLAVGAKDAGQITIHVEDSASEATTYSFSGTIDATQFNMP
jgi:predicted aspartyl protease